MRAVLRTRTTGETAGFMKVLVEAEGDRILGFAMIGPEAGEVMAVVQTAMLGGLPYTVLRDAILAHPTMAEGLNAQTDALLTRPLLEMFRESWIGGTGVARDDPRVNI